MKRKHRTHTVEAFTQTQSRYARNLTRINEGLSPVGRVQARAILEWVSCSMVPVSPNEVQQALSVARGKDPSRGRKELPLDVVQCCGPLLEIIDERIYFVHFSAKE